VNKDPGVFYMVVGMKGPVNLIKANAGSAQARQIDFVTLKKRLMV
jgi:hypothetical protein